MCTGLEIAAMVAGPLISGAGTMIQQKEAEKNAQRMAEARNERLRNTLTKNDALAKQSRDTFNERAQKITKDQMGQTQEDATQNRQQDLEAAVESTPTATATVPISGSAPKVVQSELAKRMGDAIGQSKEQAQRLGKLGGYGDSWLEQGFQDVNAGRSIAGDANFASGNMAILPYQQDIAEVRASKPISPIGGLLQGFGSMVGSAMGGMPKKSMTDPWAGMRGSYI